MGINRYKEAYIQLNLMAHDLERDIHALEDFVSLSESEIDYNKKYISHSRELLEKTKDAIRELEGFESWIKLQW